MALSLSVAIIFKNEIRCIERCLKSLLPLKERVSCEIVMADTGSTDGSREIAERYADTLFDFPWVDDFSAARNAVLQRCLGEWVLVVDCDEWLDPNFDELVDFLHGKAAARRYDDAFLEIRDYLTADFEEVELFFASRLLRMASGPRYEGKIHESPSFKRPLDRSMYFKHVTLHHDGYVMLNDGSAAGRAKRNRNRTLLRQELERTPDNPRLLLQYLESSRNVDEDYLPALHRAMESVEQKKPGWNEFGPIVFRQALYAAYDLELPEFQEWSRRSQELFPESYYTRIDGSFIRIGNALRQEDNDAVISNGETYLEAYAAYPNDPRGRVETSHSALVRNLPYWAQFVELRLAGAYCTKGQPARALPLLEHTDWSLLDQQDTTFFIHMLKALAGQGVDIGGLLGACWNGIRQPIPSAARARERVAAFQKLVSIEDASDQQTEQAGVGTPEASAGRDGASRELLELAAKVRAILARYPADDPAVIELKNSEAYKKVAYLIER